MTGTIRKKEIKSEIIALRVKPTIRKKLELIAEKEDRSISYLINKVLENSLKISV